MDVIIPINLVCALFGPAIPTLSFNFIQLLFILVTVPFLLPSGQNQPFVSFSDIPWPSGMICPFNSKQM